MSMDSELPVIAFSSNGTNNKNAFVIANTSAKEKPVEVTVIGNNSQKFKAFRTNGKEEKYSYIGEIGAVDNKILYAAPLNSVTTFFSID